MTYHYPSLFAGRRAGGFCTLSATAPMLACLPFLTPQSEAAAPKRKSLSTPHDNLSFVKPIKQSFVKNPRLMPMTRIMLTLLSGWAGQGAPLETTVGIIAKQHLGRCRRQVFRYLQDALEEGYLTYTKTKDRIGLYTGIRIRLNFAAIRHTQVTQQLKPKTARTSEVTHPSETKDKSIFKQEQDSELWERLQRLARAGGYDLPDTT